MSSQVHFHVNGRHRVTHCVSSSITADELEAVARRHEKIAGLIEDQQIRRVIKVVKPNPGMPMLVNFDLVDGTV